MTNRFRWTAELIRVIDGDTVVAWIELDFGVKIRATIRLPKIDTPEIHTAKKNTEEYSRGLRAKEFVEELFRITGPRFQIESDGERLDKYGRVSANILLHNGEWLDEKLIKAGLAEWKDY